MNDSNTVTMEIDGEDVTVEAGERVSVKFRSSRADRIIEESGRAEIATYGFQFYTGDRTIRVENPERVVSITGNGVMRLGVAVDIEQ